MRHQIFNSVINDTIQKKPMKPIDLNEIPVVDSKLSRKDILKRALQGFADDKSAKIYISKTNDNFYGPKEKIVIIWEQPHSEFGEDFTTKYFIMNKPGVLEWGHDGGTILISK